jgi:hypothetical protein
VLGHHRRPNAQAIRLARRNCERLHCLGWLGLVILCLRRDWA